MHMHPKAPFRASRRAAGRPGRDRRRRASRGASRRLGATPCQANSRCLSWNDLETREKEEVIAMLKNAASSYDPVTY